MLPGAYFDAPRGELGNASTAEERAAHQSAVQRWTAAREEQPEGSAAQAAAEKKQRMANCYWLYALDHALQTGANLKLCDFLPFRRATALQPGERRYFCDEADVVQGNERGVRRRSCIENTATKQRRLELPTRGSGVRDLVLVQDQGPVGWPASEYLFTQLGISGFWLRDPFHRLWRDQQAAVKTSGMYAVALELIVCLNHRTQPFGTSGFHQATRAAMLEITRVSDEHNELFSAALWRDMQRLGPRAVS